MNEIMKVTPRVIRGDNVVLEPISLSHARGLWDIGQVAEDWRYLPRPCFCSIEDTIEWVKEALALSQKGDHVTYVIMSTTTKQILGSTRYLNIRGKDRSVEIGWTWLARASQQTSVNTETKYLLLSYAFDILGAHRVEFKTDGRNERSQRAIERIGASKEGVFRRHAVVQKGYVRDSVYFSIIDNEWDKVKMELCAKLDSVEA